MLCTNRKFSGDALRALNEASTQHSVSFIDGPALRVLLENLDPVLEQAIPSSAIDSDSL